MQLNRNAPCVLEALVDGLIRTHYRLDVCVACGHKRVPMPRQETGCPPCGGSARRSFYLFRGLREER
jgi:hypothetical protein